MFFCLRLHPVYCAPLFPWPDHLFLTSSLPVSRNLWFGLAATFFCVLWPCSLFLLCLCLLAYVDWSFLLGSNEKMGGSNNTDTWQCRCFFLCVCVHICVIGWLNIEELRRSVLYLWGSDFSILKKKDCLVQFSKSVWYRCVFCWVAWWVMIITASTVTLISAMLLVYPAATLQL